MDRDGDEDTRPTHTTRRRVITATGAVGVGLLAGCSGSDDSDGGDTSNDDSSGGGSVEGEGSDGSEDDGSGGEATDESMDDGSGSSEEPTDAEPGGSWRTEELTDVLTGKTFSVDGLAGPVAVQSFAVWCPKCERQSEELAKTGESVTVVSLNTDPNEDAKKVRQHAERNGFDWRFAVAPTEMTKSLVEEFGTAVTNAPSTPIIVACDGGGAQFFSGSQQSADQIQSAAAEC